MSEPGVPDPPPILGFDEGVPGDVRCIRCGRSLAGLSALDQCPGCKAPVADSLTRPTVEESFCIQCGYALRGLQPDGACPECGTAIERSLRGHLLEYSSLEYVRSLRRGAWLVLAAIIVQIITLIFTLVITAVAIGIGAAPGNTFAIDIIANGVGVLVAFMSLYGWWLLSERDPAYTGRDEGTTARQVIRWAVIIAAGYTIINFAVQAVPAVAANQSMLWLIGLVAIVSFIVAAVKFFASMFYLRWLAPRLPNEKVYARARMLMWLGPLLVTVGAACFLLGLLVALVLYWNLIYWVYKDLARIERQITAQAPAC